jgi:RNA polymerase sigma-70 factor (ECF subfamily)
LSRRAAVRSRWREEYVGPWLPELVVDTAALAPDSRTELTEDLSIALLLNLEQLSPLERAHRGHAAQPRRSRVRAGSMRTCAADIRIHGGNRVRRSHTLVQLLASDVRVVTDGGGKVRAASNVIDGADRVARGAGANFGVRD